MLREVAHFFRHAPATAVLQSRVSQDDMYETVMARADAAGLAEQRVALNKQGCHMDRDTEQTLARAGFVLDAVHPFQVFSPGLPAFPMRRIESRVRG